MKHRLPKAEHLTAGEIERLNAGEANAGDYRRAVRHLLTGCRQCGLLVGALAATGQLSKEMAEAPDYDSVIEAFERRLNALLSARDGDFSQMSAEEEEIMAPGSKKPATTTPTPRGSRLRQLVPIIESFSPELRDLVVEQIDALVNLVIVFERYKNRTEDPSGRTKAAKGRRKGAGSQSSALRKKAIAPQSHGR